MKFRNLKVVSGVCRAYASGEGLLITNVYIFLGKVMQLGVLLYADKQINRYKQTNRLLESYGSLSAELHETYNNLYKI